jgi:hypothetical protein
LTDFCPPLGTPFLTIAATLVAQHNPVDGPVSAAGGKPFTTHIHLGLNDRTSLG